MGKETYMWVKGLIYGVSSLYVGQGAYMCGKWLICGLRGFYLV